jgi:hypothetical protein
VRGDEVEGDVAELPHERFGIVALARHPRLREEETVQVSDPNPQGEGADARPHDECRVGG